jgi:CBS domain-containing protein
MPVPPDSDELLKLKGKKRSVTELLALFNEDVRDQAVVMMITTALEGVGLTTVPSFITAGHDEEIYFVTPTEAGADDEVAEQPPSPVPGAQTTRVEVLPAASCGLISVQPGTSLDNAITLMMSDRLSQLPVLDGNSALRGMVTWRSIWGMRARGCEGTVVEDALEDEDIPMVRRTDKLLTALDQIRKHGYTLVHTADGTFSGIITHTDIVEHFGLFAAPFFAVGEIERRLRTCVERYFNETDIAHTKVNVKTFSKFTLGSYWYFFNSDQNWQKLGWKVIAQEQFLAKLDGVLSIRNDVMHFSPSLLTDEKQQRLDEFAGLLRLLVR